MGRLEEAMSGGDGERAEQERKLAAAIRESRENTQEFVGKMRALGHGTISLYARLSSIPVQPEPTRKPWQLTKPKQPVYFDKRPIYEYSTVGRGWAVNVGGSEGGLEYAFVVNDPEEPTVYKNGHEPSTSDNLAVRPDDVSQLETPCLILNDQLHYPAREHYVVEGMFSGDLGLRMLVSAIGKRGLPGY